MMFEVIKVFELARLLFRMFLTSNFLNILMQKKMYLHLPYPWISRKIFFSSWRPAIGGNSQLFWLLLKPMFSDEEPVSVEDAPLCSASIRSLRSGEEDKHPQMLLVLSWWSLVLFELGFLKQRIWYLRVSLWFAVPHSGVFLLVTKIILNSHLYWIHVFQQTFDSSVGRPMTDRQEKNFSTKSRVRKKMIQLFFWLFALVHLKHYHLTYWRFG